MPEPQMSSEYRHDLPYSQQWADANKGLFRHLSDVLRLLEPEMYVRYTSIRRFLPPNVNPLCGAWYACAINQNMTEDGTAHLDHSDYYCGLNVVTGWGSFTSAKLLLWQLDLAIEVKPGDAIMFLGRMLTHNAVDIQGGVRNIVDAFVHQAPLSWKDVQHKKLTRYGRKGKPVQLDMDGDEDMDTDDEMHAMYTGRPVIEDEDEGEDGDNDD
jgi:hypothetical protein